MKLFKQALLPISLLFSATLWAQGPNCNDAIPESTPTAAFTFHGDGTVTHNATGLMWQRCLLGQTLDDNGTSTDYTDDSCTGSAAYYNWQDALNQAQSNYVASMSDWRVPNIKELKSIVEYHCKSPAINSEVFPGQSSSSVWSSSPVVNYSTASYAWFVYFYGGGDSWYYRGNDAQVRLVRSGQ